MHFVPDIEPMLPSDDTLAKTDIPNKCIELMTKAAELKGRVSPVTAQVLEEHMSVINSYYSNKIEGNSTHPRDIRMAQNGEYKADPLQRNLQLESVALIKAQQAIAEDCPDPQRLLSPDFLLFIHKAFYEQVPESLREAKSRDGKTLFNVNPGELRQEGQDVIVGAHLPQESAELPAYLARFSEAYALEYKKGIAPLVAAMCSHHRLAWIHPFVDGNGRVARLHTDIFLQVIGIGAAGVWCLSRGLARNHAAYRAVLAKADGKRGGDGDGRGARTESGLAEFCLFMLDTAIDQVDYMSDLLQLEGMSARIKAYVRARNDGLIRGMEKLRPEAVRLLDQAFRLGEFPREEMVDITGLSLSVTRKLVGQLKREGLLTEVSSRSPLRFAVPEHAEAYYFPQLTPAI